MGVLRRVVAGLVAMLATVASAGTVTYYHNDLTGSPVAATNASGQVIWRESYRPYGERLTNSAASAGDDIWFTSRRQDAETGLVYMGARYYDPVIGRFISTDPKGFDEGNIHSHNRYAYANNNPYRYVDPDGKMGQVLVAIAIRVTPVALRALATLGSGIGIGIYNATHPDANANQDASSDRKIDVESGKETDPADKSGELSRAGRAQQKHGDREGSAFDPAKGTPADKNEQGQRTLEGIVNSPDRTVEDNRRGGTDVRESSDGRGARFGKDGKFTGFIEPREPK